MTGNGRRGSPVRSAIATAAILLAAAGIAVSAVRLPGRSAGAVPAAAATSSDTAPPSAVAQPPAAANARAAANAQAAAQAPTAARPNAPAETCDRCHSELELLRQQGGGLARAQELLVPAHVVAASAHTGMTCAECHTGFTTYPHERAPTTTRSCVSCHASADSLWQQGVHAAADEPVSCAQCHTVHQVAAADSLKPGPHATSQNATCVSCHTADAIDLHLPHGDSVPCASCHAPHDTRPSTDAASWLAPGRQAATCANCHDSISNTWSRDIHGDTVLRAAHLAGREPVADEVTCTSCHDGHRMMSPDSAAFPTQSVASCAGCHEKAGRTFYGSYHGRATALGSMVSASCADCHGAHEILPDSMPASHVAEANLVETCRACHENARPAFVKYDSHPEPFNRARNPWLFFAFFMMNAMLVGVMLVFGTHTLLWWFRIWLDGRRGIVHGPGHGHGHSAAHDSSDSVGDTTGGVS